MKRMAYVMFFFFLVSNEHAYGMGKFKLRKKKSSFIHHSDAARDLRKPWRCECKKCTKKLRDENKKHAAQWVDIRRKDLSPPPALELNDKLTPGRYPLDMVRALIEYEQAKSVYDRKNPLQKGMLVQDTSAS